MVSTLNGNEQKSKERKKEGKEKEKSGEMTVLYVLEGNFRTVQVKDI